MGASVAVVTNVDLLMLRRFVSVLFCLPLLLGLALPCDAAELQLSEVRLDPCGELDAGNQPELSRPGWCQLLCADGRR